MNENIIETNLITIFIHNKNIKEPLWHYTEHSGSVSVMRVEDEIDLGLILEQKETLKKDEMVSGMVCGRNRVDERDWGCGRGFLKEWGYGEVRDEERMYVYMVWMEAYRLDVTPLISPLLFIFKLAPDYLFCAPVRRAPFQWVPLQSCRICD